MRRASPARESAAGRAATQELGVARGLYERVVREGAPHLVTLIGEAGVGKSRLLREFERGSAQHPSKPTVPHRALPALRQRHRVLGARRGAARRVRDRRLRLVRRGLAQAARLRAATCSGRRVRRDVRAPGGADRARCSASRCRPSSRPTRTTPSGCARRSSRRCAAASRRSPAGARSCSPSRTSTGPTTACSTRSSTSRSGCARRCCSSASPATSCSTAAPAGAAAAARATQLFLEPLSDEHSARAGARAARPRASEVRRRPVAERSGGNPLFAEEMARRIAEEGTIEAARAAGHRSGGARRAARLARRRSSAASCSRRRWWAARSGRARWRRWRPRRGATSSRALSRCRRRTSSPPAPTGRWPASASSPSSTC